MQETATILLSGKFRSPKKLMSGLLSTILAAMFAMQPLDSIARANSHQIPLVRDAEIEALVPDYAKPILQGTGLRPDIQVILLNDQSFNAFVDGQRIFINIGTLMQAETPNKVIWRYRR